MKCPDDFDQVMYLTNWKPPRGVDPRLRQFRCPLCKMVIYKVPEGFERAQKVYPQTGNR